MPRFKETRENVLVIPYLSVTASWRGFTAGSASKSAVYNPPLGWTILSTDVVVHSSNNGSRSVSTVAQDANLATEELIERVYKGAIEASAKYKNEAVEALLKEELEERTTAIRQWRANKNTIVAEVSAEAHGSLADRKRGWEEISVLATLVYVGENLEDQIASELEQAYGIDLPHTEEGS